MLKDWLTSKRGARRGRVSSLLIVATLVVTGLTSVSQGASAASTPKYDDNATVVFAGTPFGADLDPYKAGGLLVGVVDIYEGLFRPTPQQKIVPWLATGYKYSTDNLTLTLTLRDDVKFQDGSTFDSAAVVASLNRARGGATSLQKPSLAAITDVAAVDAKTVKITLSHPDATLVSVLGSPAGFIMNPKMINDAAAIQRGASGLGTGPYIVKSFVGLTKIVMERNDSYWDKASIKHAPKTYEYDFNANGTSRLNGLTSGQYMAIQAVGTPGLNGAGGLPDVNKDYVNSIVPGYALSGIAFNLSKPPFNNEKVRLAVSHALDFKTADEGVLGDVINCAPAPSFQIQLPNVVGYDAKLKGPSYDLKLAKSLLAEAGYPNGAGFPTISIAGALSSNEVHAAEVFQGMLARIGINATIDSQPSRVFVVAELQANRAQMAPMQFPGGIDPAFTIDQGILPVPMVDDSTAGQEYKTLATSAKVELDPTKRADMYKKMSSLALDHAFYIPYCRLRAGYANVKKVTGILDSFYPMFGSIPEARTLKVLK